MFGLPRDPDDRTPEQWEMVELGGLFLRWMSAAFVVGIVVGFALAWVIL